MLLSQIIEIAVETYPKEILQHCMRVMEKAPTEESKIIAVGHHLIDGKNTRIYTLNQILPHSVLSDIISMCPCSMMDDRISFLLNTDKFVKPYDTPHKFNIRLVKLLIDDYRDTIEHYEEFNDYLDKRELEFYKKYLPYYENALKEFEE